MSKKAIIIGAGPAGLAAAYELLKRTDIIPVIIERSGEVGGLSKTVNYKGNCMDIGPHRFFLNSDRAKRWLLKIIPLEETIDQSIQIRYQHKTRVIEDPCSYHDRRSRLPADNKMLVIPILNRICFLGKFFSYPIRLNKDLLRAFGFTRTIGILCSFLWSRVILNRPSTSLEDLIIHRSGNEKAELSQAHQGHVSRFLYPRYGQGSLWEEVARQVQAMGGEIHLHQTAQTFYTVGEEICSIHAVNTETGELTLFSGEYFFSTMPVGDLIAGMEEKAPGHVKEIASELQYQAFISVGVLLTRLSDSITDEASDLKDTWIDIREKGISASRMTIYNNWGGAMVRDPGKVWVRMEYLCHKDDEIWSQDDQALQNLAITELDKMGLARVEDVLDATVGRVEKGHPIYSGGYDRFDQVRSFTDQIQNLFLIGQNGMHHCHNADHSLLTAMVAVDNVVAGITGKDSIWAVNTDQKYYDEKKGKTQLGVVRVMNTGKKKEPAADTAAM